MSKLIYIRQGVASLPVLGILAAVTARSGVPWIGGEDDSGAFTYLGYTGVWTGTVWTTHILPTFAAAEVLALALSPSHVWAADDGAVWVDTTGVTSDTPPGGSGAVTHYRALAAVSDTSVYAAGQTAANLITGGLISVRHWNGTAWGNVPIPGTNYLTTTYYINGLALDPGGGLWWVGSKVVGAGGSLKVSGSLAAGETTGAGGQYTGVWALGAADVWAVGEDTTGPPSPFEVYRNTGAGFVLQGSLPALPSTASGGGQLLSIHGTSSSDVWAVGYYNVTHPPGTLVQEALIWHYNGTTWAAATLPALPSGTHYRNLNSVWAISSSDVWAVGVLVDATNTNYQMAWHLEAGAWVDRSPIPL